MLCALFAVGYPGVRAVIEDDAVNEALDDGATLMLLRGYEAVHSRRHIHIERAGKESATCSEYQLRRYERTLYRTER